MNPYLAHKTTGPSYTQRKQKVSYEAKKQIEIKLHKKQAHTLHGNYPGYYGYRNGSGIDDHIRSFKKEWFQGKRVLDIGCNSGHITLNIARFYDPKSVEGVDIDPQLIRKARWNHSQCRSQVHEDDWEHFPISCSDQLGFMPPHYRLGHVSFRVGDFVHEPDLEPEDELFDTILALSITKWIHLNNGDGGLRFFFNKVYKYLKKGGIFLLEPQPIEGYKKRAGMAPHMRDNFLEMAFFPDDFLKFLTHKVGFRLVETLAPTHPSNGFSRVIHILQK
jgi:7SK snRNA methylphosphate capping enzyme